jgi:hypothetical protein
MKLPLPFMLLCFVCLLGATPKTNYSASRIKSSLLAYYPFDGDTRDYSGNAKHGTPMNGVGFAEDIDGKAGRAANFDGLDDYILVQDRNGYFAPSTMTVSFFFNLRDVNSRSSIICKSAFETPSAVSWSTGLAETYSPYFSFTTADGNNSCRAVWNGPGGQGTAVSHQKPLKANRWYHAVLVFDKGRHRIYLDGKLVASADGQTANLNKCGNANLRIGGWWKKDIVSINGKIDELRIYGRILSTHEIRFLYNQLN